MRPPTPARQLGRTLLLPLVLALALGACGDDGEVSVSTDSTYPAEATGGTGTMPIPGPADWLRWTPAESPDAADEATLVAALDELGLGMIVPASPPPAGGPAEAIFNSQGLGYGSGQTFPGTTGISLNVVYTGGHVVVSAPTGQMTVCSDGAVTVILRGDADACALDQGESSEVWWDEGDWSFRASFSDGLTLDQGLAWLETWRLLP